MDVSACTALFGAMWVTPVVWGNGSVDVSACTELFGLMWVNTSSMGAEVWTFLPALLFLVLCGWHAPVVREAKVWTILSSQPGVSAS